MRWASAGTMEGREGSRVVFATCKLCAPLTRALPCNPAQSSRCSAATSLSRSPTPTCTSASVSTTRQPRAPRWGAAEGRGPRPTGPLLSRLLCFAPTCDGKRRRPETRARQEDEEERPVVCIRCRRRHHHASPHLTSPRRNWLQVVADSATGRSRGYGFVRFSSEPERDRAMGEMNGAVLCGRPVRLSMATPKMRGGGGGADLGGPMLPGPPMAGGAAGMPLQPPAAITSTSGAAAGAYGAGGGGDENPHNTVLFVGESCGGEWQLAASAWRAAGTGAKRFFHAPMTGRRFQSSCVAPPRTARQPSLPGSTAP